MNLFNENGVRYRVTGGYAVMLYAEPRYTKGLDLWVDPSPANAANVHRALTQFGAPMTGVTPEDFASEGLFYQMGRPPIRVDVITSIDGVSFQQAWPNRRMADFGGIQIPFIGLTELIRNKKATGRLQDLADAERLESGQK
ncbi:MAG: hypothetical protein U0R19_31235 [Bryobacteraceae bacterium]